MAETEIPIIDQCSPGSHPHSDRPNWRPAETAEEYQRNCAEGLEAYSERRMAKLLGISRALAWRAQLAAQIPQDLLDRLKQKSDRPLRTKTLAAIALAIKRGKVDIDVECCPNCGHVLRMRQTVSDQHMQIVNDWMESPDEQGGSAPP